MPSCTFTESCTAIEAAYDQLGHRRGWRFLTSPQATLDRSNPIALITLNPGGARPSPQHDGGSAERGSAYVVESWGPHWKPGEAPLQTQIRRLFATIAAACGEPGTGDALLHRTLAAHFVPFRSPTLATLTRRRESLAFAGQLWSRIFANLDPQLIVTIDQHTTLALTAILEEKLEAPPRSERFPVGWGSITAEMLRFEKGGEARVILRLPHLSRFRLFGRPTSDGLLRSLVERAVAQPFGRRVTSAA